MDLGNLFSEYDNIIKTSFESYLSEKNELVDAMRYAVSGGGKRIRPTLAFEFCKAAGGKLELATDFSLAIELIHAYSLIHDDLPCMDDDDMRRGRPSLHRAFSETTALLAGDALQALAFEVLFCSSHKNAKPAGIIISRAAGYTSMVGGQLLDLQYEGKHDININELTKMHSGKTGALIEAACVCGCLASKQAIDSEYTQIAKEYASHIGLAFQIKDDILDVTGDEKIFGKPIGSDSASNKTTFVSLMSVDEAESLVSEHTEKAKKIIKNLPHENHLAELADFLANRNY